ncbi:MAG: aspartate-semialdehyde dehydrogenase [Phycisphaerae bacterium]|nr:aspartate-semialdehyde dehydrogenase [Phycisphaerae bacterium]
MFKRVAIVGATGAVGEEFEAVLRNRKFPASDYVLLASARSAGKSVRWIDRERTIRELGPDSFAGCDLAFFSAGGSISKQFAPLAVKAGAVVVDNSSAFRMDESVPLVVPEVNPEAIRTHKGIIANPNCSTIILNVALWPLHRVNRAVRVVVSTYQAASGAGAKALAELELQTRAVLAGQAAKPEVFPVPCAFNVFSHNSAVGPDGYNVEETKMILETRKIFGDARIAIAPTCMRVPVKRAHTESVSIEFEKPMSPAEAKALLEKAPGVKIVDEPTANRFPTPLEASGKDDVLVGRIRADQSIGGGRGLQFICTGDQLLKGAALNAVQIAEMLR